MNFSQYSEIKSVPFLLPLSISIKRLQWYMLIPLNRYYLLIQIVCVISWIMIRNGFVGKTIFSY